jgi:hypothetical protein
MHRLSALPIALTALLVLACEVKDGVLTDIDLETTTETTAPELTTSSATGVTGESSESGDTDTTTGGEAICAEHPAFSASLAAWQTALAESGGDYYYTVDKGDAGFEPEPFCRYRTTVVVSAGAVVERRHELLLQSGDITCDPNWIETGADIGSHDDFFTAPAVTMDALYTGCCDEALHIEPAEDYTTHFEPDEAGLLKTCYALMNSCGEACHFGPFGGGLFLESFAFGPPPPPAP